MDYKKETIAEIEKKGGTISSKHALVGFDGFVDKIKAAVDKRMGPGDNYTPISTIAEFGGRISAAAGKSTNIELYPTMEKLGGNGPIMANALANGGLNVRYIGALGTPTVHPVFSEFATKTNAVSVANPGITDAVEFSDGKILLGDMAGLGNVTYDNIVKTIGEGPFFDIVSRADLFSIVNWTMLPHMTAIYNDLLNKVLPNLPQGNARNFFFDLADPEKRSETDIRTALSTISKFGAHGHVTLGLNLKEGQHVFKILGNSAIGTSGEDLKRMATAIRQSLDIQCVVIHPVEGAACAKKGESWYVEGPYCAEPLITTGAGDHFNAGFTMGQLLDLPPPACLTVAVGCSGYYVRTAKSPSIFDIAQFIREWD